MTQDNYYDSPRDSPNSKGIERNYLSSLNRVETHFWSLMGGRWPHLLQHLFSHVCVIFVRLAQANDFERVIRNIAQ
jgi:hypothetical protein